jgi:hypothetical protein
MYFSVYLKITSSFNSFEIIKGSQLPGVKWHTLFPTKWCAIILQLLHMVHIYIYILVCSKVQGFTTAWQDMVWDILVSYIVMKSIFVNYISFVIGTIILLQNYITDSLCYFLNSVIHQASHFTKTVKSLTMIVFTHLHTPPKKNLCEVFIKLYGQKSEQFLLAGGLLQIK